MPYCWVLPGKGGKPRSLRVVRLARRCFEKTGEFAKFFEIVEIFPNAGSNLSKLVEIFRMARMARMFSSSARTTISWQTNRAKRGFGRPAPAVATLIYPDLL